MERFAELIQRLLEIQRGERRNPALIERRAFAGPFTEESLRSEARPNGEVEPR